MSSPKDPRSPTEAILGSQRQIVYQVHFWTLVVIVPMVLVQWRQGHPLLAGLLALFALNLGLVLLCLKWRNVYLFQGRGFAVFATLSTVYSTVINGHIGLYWAYPAIAALFFLLRPREALWISLTFLWIMIIVAHQRFSEAEFWRITFSLALTTTFTAVFAWLVGRLQGELTQIATHDALTGCLNRTQLAELLDNQVHLKTRYGRPAALIVIDLDHFKQLNDRWGHPVGDLLLKGCASRLRQRLRECDALFRLGGEEFLILLPETRCDDALRLAHVLLDSVRQETFVQGIALTCSAGVAEVHSGENWSSWLARADQALYVSKNEGRNRVSMAPQIVENPV
ncbi:MAG: GGDEF domain-containing protein [Gammaproteobacteria bacterium]|nr:GGDEF domain-containing protein [Gammaproteobacteria bacterium]